MGKFEIEDIIDHYLEERMADEKLPVVPESDLGLGFEDMDGQDFSFPFLVICDPKSPYLNPTHQLYIEEARQGMIINQQNNHVYNEVNVIPCKYTFRFVEWIPRKSGGGFVSSYKRGQEPQDTTVDPLTNRSVRKNGNELMGTGYYLCLLQEEDWERVIVPMASTQLKKARKWNSLADSFKQNGKPQPLFNKLYTLSTVGESNSKGTWYGWKIDFANDFSIYELDQDLYNHAKKVCQTPTFLPEQFIKSIADQSETEAF